MTSKVSGMESPAALRSSLWAAVRVGEDDLEAKLKAKLDGIKALKEPNPA